MDGDEEARRTGSCLGRGRDPSRHLLWGFPLVDQTPSVRLVQPGGLRGSHACLVFGLLPAGMNRTKPLELNCCAIPLTAAGVGGIMECLGKQGSSASRSFRCWASSASRSCSGWPMFSALISSFQRNGVHKICQRGDRHSSCPSHFEAASDPDASQP